MNPVELWGGELPKGHALRKFAGWEGDLHTAMQRYYDADLDEYSKDPEDVADAVLSAKMAELAPEPEEPKKTAKRPNTPKARAEAPAAKKDLPPPPKGHRPVKAEEVEEEAPKDMVARERWAIERARRHMRGEKVYDI